MSCRQSARKVKLTSKFEEFSTTRLASIQRLAHSSELKQQNQEAKNSRSDVKHEPKQSPATTPTSKAAAATPVSARAAAAAAAAAASNANATQSISSTAVSSTTTTTTATTPATKTRESASAKATPAYNNHDTTSHSLGIATPQPKLTANGKIRGRPRKCWQKAETTVKPMSSTREELLRLREELAQVKKELEERNNEYAELRRQSSYTGQTVPKGDYDDLKERYQRDIMHAKRHEWCVMCLNQSRYYCCWNTTYCSQKCQVMDWYARHGKSCERRRALKTVSQ